MKKKKNKNIYWVKRYINKYREGLQKNGADKDYQNQWELEYLESIKYEIEEKRPNKQKTAYEQMSDEQIEFMEWLENRALELMK